MYVTLSNGFWELCVHFEYMDENFYSAEGG